MLGTTYIIVLDDTSVSLGWIVLVETVGPTGVYCKIPYV